MRGWISARWGAVLALGVALGLTGCDPQRIQELEEDVSTEADVRDRFGVPENVWKESNGSQTFEYNRQPAGHTNYMITIGPSGKMTALRQVLAPHNFEKVLPGMSREQVRRMLGKPAKQASYTLKQETEWDWNWIDPPGQEKIFTVVFGPDGLVRRAGSADKLPEGR